MCAAPGAPMIAPTAVITIPTIGPSASVPINPQMIAVNRPPAVAASGCFLTMASGSMVLSEGFPFLPPLLSPELTLTTTAQCGRLPIRRARAASGLVAAAAGSDEVRHPVEDALRRGV